jgi:ATP-dependent Zn protease
VLPSTTRARATTLTNSANTLAPAVPIEECHRDADRLLGAHRDKLESLAKALLNAESLDEKEIRCVIGLIAHAPDTRSA